jgi:lantibiotic modifying enzyme
VLALSAAKASGIEVDGLIGDAQRWEDGYYDVSRGGWPDLRVSARPPALAWCHGAPGVGIAAAYRATLFGDELAEVTFARARLAAAAHRPNGAAFDGSMCHGLTGAVELHLAASAAWPSTSAEHLRSARLVARHLTRAGSGGHPPWTCGVSGGLTPNVLVGLAGIAITLVRCHDPSIVSTLAHPGLPASVAHSVKRN